MRFDIKFTEENKELLDSSKVLEEYNSKFKALSQKLQIVKFQKKRYDDFVENLHIYIRTATEKEFSDIDVLTTKFLEKADKLKAEFDETKSKSRKHELSLEMSILHTEMEGYEKRYNEILKPIAETVEILRPIDETIQNLEKTSKKIWDNVCFLKLKKLSIEMFYILFFALLLSFFFDELQSRIEHQFSIKHFFLVTLFFGVQYFIVEPLFLNPLKKYLNWQIIEELRMSLPQFETTLLESAMLYNSYVTKYKELEHLEIKFD